MKKFPPFTLDEANQCLRKDGQPVELTPKAFTLLSYLVDRAGRLVTKDELLNAVWPGTFVQEAVLKVCVLEIRKALSDPARQPLYVETVHRRGYRFVAPVANETWPASPPAPRSAGLLGRAEELARLRSLLRQAAGGERQLVLVAGEAGIGKSALIEHFLLLEWSDDTVAIARGQCLEHFGGREPFYPIFDALSRAARELPAMDVVQTLRRHAPTWLVQMPSLVPAGEADSLRRDTFGASRERMLREMSETLEVLATRKPLVLVLEDLHWSDVSTLDLLSWITSRKEPAALLVLATYRPAEVIRQEHSLQQLRREWQSRGLCTELSLDALSLEETAGLLTWRFPANAFPDGFARMLYRHTGGHPLFLVNVVEDAVRRGELIEEDGLWRLHCPLDSFDLGVPHSLVHMIDRQVEQIASEEREALESAATAGVEVPVLCLVDTEAEAESLERCFDGLARRRMFLQSAPDVILPDGRVSACYRFLHPPVQHALYARLSASRRARLHRQIAERLRRLYASRPHDAAPAMAHHFEHGRHPAEAVECLKLAAARAASLHAHREAVALLESALELLARLPEPVQIASEPELLEQLGLVHRLQGDFDRATGAFRAMIDSAARTGGVTAQINGYLWLASVYSWFDREKCLAAVDDALGLMGRERDPGQRAIARAQAAYWNLLFRGWSDEEDEASRAGLIVALTAASPSNAALIRCRHSYFESLRSDYRAAGQTAEEGIEAALQAGGLVDYAIGYYFRAWALLHCGEWGEMSRLLAVAGETANRNGHLLWAGMFDLLRAWLHLQAGSFKSAQSLCRRSLERAELFSHPFSRQMGMILLGASCVELGETDSAAATLNEVRIWHSQERILMDWIWKMPLAQALTELHLCLGDAAAIEEAERFVQVANATSERTWQGLARHAAARAALAGDDAVRGRAHIEAGLAAIKGIEAPLASWRLHGLAARVFDDAEHRSVAVNAITRLLDSLKGEEKLQVSFRHSLPVQEILSASAPEIDRMASHRARTLARGARR